MNSYNNFNDFCENRMRFCSGKYLDYKGINKALYCRDNMIDILEELADFINIAHFLKIRLDILISSNINDNYFAFYMKDIVNSACNYINQIGNDFYYTRLNKSYPEILKRDEENRKIE